MNHLLSNTAGTLKWAFIGFIFLTFSSLAFAGGAAVCIYTTADGEVICSTYSNSGLGAEQNCKAEAEAAGSPGYLDCPSYDVNGCATGIFSNAFDNPPHTYCFFTGNSGCKEQICAEAIQVLPIRLIEFKGELINNSNVITWSTASELNNEYYYIDHSDDGTNWSTITQLSGAGTSSEIKSYKVIHNDPEIVINYYKLYQVDYDGTTVSYGPISIDNREKKRTLLKVVNLLGQEVDETYEGIVIYVYDDGTREKIYQ